MPAIVAVGVGAFDDPKKYRHRRGRTGACSSRKILVCIYAILWRSPKNCEEKEQRALPFEPACALAVRGKARAEISYI